MHSSGLPRPLTSAHDVTAPTCLGRQFVQPRRVNPREHSRDHLLRNHQRVHTRQPATQPLNANTDLVKLHYLLLSIPLDDKLRAHTHTHDTHTWHEVSDAERSQTRARSQAPPPLSPHDTIMGRVQQVVSVCHTPTLQEGIQGTDKHFADCVHYAGGAGAFTYLASMIPMEAAMDLTDARTTGLYSSRSTLRPAGLPAASSVMMALATSAV